MRSFFGGSIIESINSFGARASLEVGKDSYQIYRLDAVKGDGLDVASLPYGLKILPENLLRTENGTDITPAAIRALAGRDAHADPSREMFFDPQSAVSGKSVSVRVNVVGAGIV